MTSDADAFDLDGLPGYHRLEHVPVKCYNIAQVFVVVHDGFGHHLTIQLHPYGLHHDGAGWGDGEWVPPYASREVRTNGPHLRTVEEVRQLLDSEEDPEAMETLARVRASQLGLGGLKPTALAPLTQLKRSLRTPELWMVFRFHRFLISASESVENTADPEGLFGLHHLPLDDLEQVTDRRTWNGRAEWWFRNKRISSDLQSLLASPQLPRLYEAANDLGETGFHQEREGLILVTDVARWGTALFQAGDSLAIKIDGERNKERFLAETTKASYRFLSRIGPAYSADTGDGTIAVFHGGIMSPEETARKIFKAADEWSVAMEGLNRYLPSDAAVGTRFALHYGTYQYGRIGQALSQGPAVRGQRVVEAARLENGLANFLRGEGAELLERRAPGSRHTLAISDAALPHCALALERLRGKLIDLGDHDVRSKESVIHARIWCLDQRGH